MKKAIDLFVEPLNERLDRRMNLPVFELVTLGLTGEIDKSIRVPRVILGLLYQVQDELTVMRTSGDRLLYRFASTGLSGQICIADDTGEILVLHDSNPRPVNSSLEKFTECVRVVIDRFPYYGVDSDWEDQERVGRELAELLTAIDPVSLQVDSFWDTFINDVEIGDFATEEVTGL
jgi:hypothetical protein